MPKLPIISYKKLAKKLHKANFELIRTSKHPIYYNAEKGITIPVPNHLGDVPKGTLRVIINEIGLSVEEFKKL